MKSHTRSMRRSSCQVHHGTVSSAVTALPRLVTSRVLSFARFVRNWVHAAPAVNLPQRASRSPGALSLTRRHMNSTARMMKLNRVAASAALILVCLSVSSPRNAEAQVSSPHAGRSSPRRAHRPRPGLSRPSAWRFSAPNDMLVLEKNTGTRPTRRQRLNRRNRDRSCGQQQLRARSARHRAASEFPGDAVRVFVLDLPHADLTGHPVPS